jgi:cytochrome c5
MMRALLALLMISFALNATAGKPLTERVKHGKQVYVQSCASCHDTGKSGAPMLSQPEQWSQRSDLWEAALFKHANEGYGLMPSGGGNQELQEYDVDAAAEYIMSEIYPDRATD